MRSTSNYSGWWLIVPVQAAFIFYLLSGKGLDARNCATALGFLLASVGVTAYAVLQRGWWIGIAVVGVCIVAVSWGRLL